MKSLVNNLRKWHNDREYAKLSIFVLVVLIILEVSLFNINFYKNMFNQPQKATLSLVGDIHNYYENEYELGAKDKAIELRNINQRVKNIYIDAEVKGVKGTKEDKKIKVVISATDDGNSEYFDLPERAIVYSIRGTKYIPLNLNGVSEKLKINFKDCSNKTLIINEVVVNSKMPFNFNAVRILALFALVALIYIIRPKNGFYNYKFNINSKKQKLVLGTVIVINAAVILALGFAHPNKGINTASHHHQYHWLAEAMMDGHFYLNVEPSQALIDMENPYDRHKRDAVMADTGDRYKWDTAYYNGKYYVYFGVVPELLFFLPTRLMGIMIINKAPVMIMTMLAVIFGYLLMRELTRRWFKNTSYVVYMLMSALFVNSIGIYTAVRIPDLYMIPISHALAFSIMGLYCWLRALPEEGSNSLKGVYLLLGSVCMALVAGCRPQVVLASFLAVPLFWKAVFKDRELFSLKTVGKSAMFVMPYVIVAAFLMYYNYARFGNVFDFGANYNLTTMDMVSEKFNVAKIPLGLYTYYLQPPDMVGIFPYIRSVEIARNFMGNYVAEAQFGGMLPCNIILLSLLYIYKVRDELKSRNIFAFTSLMLIFALVITIVDYNTGGIILRYMIDFMWLIFAACIIVIYALIEKYKNSSEIRFVYRFIAVGFVWSMAYNFMLMFNINSASYKDNIPTLYYFVQRMIEFWT